MNPVLQITYPLAATLTVAIALGLGFLITWRFRLGWRLFWIGGAVFIISQIFHIPFNAFLTRLFTAGYLPTPPASWTPVFNAVVLGLSAGVFEEVARYLGYRFWAKDARTWSKGLLYGAGHGGAEAIAIGALLMYTFFQLSALRSRELAELVPPEQIAAIQQTLDAYWSATWYDSFLAAVERAMTLPVQIGFSILVLQAFTRGRTYWLFLAILWHAAVDAAAVLAVQAWGVYQAELVVALCALISLGIIFGLRQPELEPAMQTLAPSAPANAAALSMTPADDSPDQVEDSRYL